LQPGRSATAAIERVVPRRHSFDRSSVVVAHWKSRPPFVGRDLLDAVALSVTGRLAGAVKLEEERRLQHAAQFRVAVHGVELRFVEQLDARDGNPELNRRDHGLHGPFHGVEGADGAETASGRPKSRTVISVITPSVPSEPTNRRVRS
jgi:hypothetical protein